MFRFTAANAIEKLRLGVSWYKQYVNAADAHYTQSGTLTLQGADESAAAWSQEDYYNKE
jgi:hypothetical protein